jgi:hypothetical protein
MKWHVMTYKKDQSWKRCAFKTTHFGIFELAWTRFTQITTIDGLFMTPAHPKLWQTVMHWSRSDPEIRWRTIAVKDNRSEGQEWWPVQTFTIRVQRLIKSSLFSNTSTKCKVDTMDCRMKWSPCFRGVTILQVSSLKSRLCSKMLLWSCVTRLSLESNIFWYHETSG